MIALHSQDGRHFLGLRQGKAGQYEIVYDNDRQGKRLIWRVMSKDVCADILGSQLHEAIKRASVLDALLAGLRDAEIAFEVDYDWATQATTGRK